MPYHLSRTSQPSCAHNRLPRYIHMYTHNVTIAKCDPVVIAARFRRRRNFAFPSKRRRRFESVLFPLSDHSFIPTLNIQESIERKILENKLDLRIKKFLHLRILNLRTRTRPHSVQTLMNSFLYLDY